MLCSPFIFYDTQFSAAFYSHSMKLKHEAVAPRICGFLLFYVVLQPQWLIRIEFIDEETNNETVKTVEAIYAKKE